MTAYETGVANSCKKPNLFDIINGPGRYKRQLAIALKRNVAVAKMKDRPVMPDEREWVRIWVESQRENADKVMLGNERVTSVEHFSLRDKKEKANDCNEDNVDNRKQIDYDFRPMRPVWRQRQNAAGYNTETVVDQTARRKRFARNIDILPSRVYGGVNDEQFHIVKAEQNPKKPIIEKPKSDSQHDVNHMDIRSRINAAMRHPCDDVSNGTFVEDAILNSSSHRSKVDKRTTPIEGSFRKENSKKEGGIIQEPGLTAMQECGGQDSNSKEVSSMEHRSRLLHSLKHLLRRKSDSFSTLKTHLSRRTSSCEKICYHSINIHDMTSPTDVENELNKLAVNLSKLNNEICEIKSGIDAGLTTTLSMLNAEKGLRENVL